MPQKDTLDYGKYLYLSINRQFRLVIRKDEIIVCFDCFIGMELHFNKKIVFMNRLIVVKCSVFPSNTSQFSLELSK